MADSKKFEEMLEHLISEDKKGAENLFHEIVVEKSREIYEGLLENDLEDYDSEEEDDEDVEETKSSKKNKKDSYAKEDLDLEEFEDDDEDEDVVGDETDDFANDISGSLSADDDSGVEYGDEDYGDDTGGDGDPEETISDLETALDKLRDEFEQMKSDEEGGEDEEGEEYDDSEEDSMDYDDSEEGDDEEEYDDSEETESVDELETMKEYVEKVTAKMGDEGQYNKSAYAGPNDMGGTTSNIAQNQEAETKGTKGGLEDPSTDSYGEDNENVPGGKANKQKKQRDVYSGKYKDEASNTDSIHGSKKKQGGRE